MEPIDYSGKKISEIKRLARQHVLESAVRGLKQEFETVVPINNTEIAVVAGIAPDDDGYMQDVVCVLQVTAKSWYSRKGDKRQVKKYDLDAIVEGYEE